MEITPFFERLNNWARKSIVIKLITIGILILILLIPSSMLTALIYERQSVRDGAISEVSSKWGGEQTIGGPVVSVPYINAQKNDKGVIEYYTAYAHFLPDELKISGKIVPEKRYRGIYVVVLYNTILEIEGSFNDFNCQAIGMQKDQLQFENAFLTLGITDMKGIRENIHCIVNEKTLDFGPGIPTHDIFISGASMPLDINNTGPFKFKFKLNINGSSDLLFAPFGKETDVSLNSAWGDPDFIGSFLPDERKINSSGFTASWKVLQLNRNYPQQGKGEFIKTVVNQAGTADYGNVVNDNSAFFGVKLLLPVDEYQKTMRSAKYNVMFIFITFLVFFFSEVLKKRLIHPIQYLLVGFAITLFYILLLSFSEHILFNWAYLWASLIIILLVSFYSNSVFKSLSMAGLITGILAILYVFFYSLLQLQDYALLMGSLGLLLILAAIMYLTKDIDWYSINK
jgi:inner membrane protein